MRLLLVNSAWPQSWGGGEKWTVEAACWFQEQRHAVAVAARPKSLLSESASRRGLETFELSFGGDFDPFAVRRARRLLKAYRPDAVLVNFNKEAWQFGFAARALRIPMIARHGFPLLRNSLHHRYLLNKLITRLIVNAASIREHYRDLGLPVEDADVILNGVRGVEQKRGELRGRYEIESDQTLVVAAGRVESQKRFDRVIELASQLAPSHPDLRFLILGSGPLKEELQAEIDARGLGERVRIGRFHRELASQIGDADLFVLTSDNEGSPNVLLEAMAAGVCCVATAVGAVPQILEGELAENAIPAGDSDALVKRVVQLVIDPNLRRTIGTRMQARTQGELSFEKSMRSYERMVAQLVLKRA